MITKKVLIHFREEGKAPVKGSLGFRRSIDNSDVMVLWNLKYEHRNRTFITNGGGDDFSDIYGIITEEEGAFFSLAEFPRLRLRSRVVWEILKVKA